MTTLVWWFGAASAAWTFGGGGDEFATDDEACEALADSVSPSYDMERLEPASQPDTKYCYTDGHAGRSDLLAAV